MNGTHGQEFLANEGGMAWQSRAEATGREGICVVELTRRGLAGVLRDEVRAAWAACGAFEWVALAYLAVSSALIGLFEENLAHPLRLLGVQASVAGLILTLCWIEARPGRLRGPILTNRGWGNRARKQVSAFEPQTFGQKSWHFWRHWYPHLFFLFCFEELGYLMGLVTSQWQDAKLIAFDHWLTRVHPSIWLEQFATPGRNEFMQFAYITYFLYLLALGGVLYHRKDWLAYWAVMTYSAAAYAIGYVIAIFFPVESPWFAMAGAWQGDLHGGVFTATINFIEHYGRVRGAAFPSEHVAGSVAALWGAWRHRRWLFWVMLPLAVCMGASTVWGRYHYVADVLAGVVTGTLGYVVGALVLRRGLHSTVHS